VTANTKGRSRKKGWGEPEGAARDEKESARCGAAGSRLVVGSSAKENSLTKKKRDQSSLGSVQNRGQNTQGGTAIEVMFGRSVAGVPGGRDRWSKGTGNLLAVKDGMARSVCGKKQVARSEKEEGNGTGVALEKEVRDEGNPVVRPGFWNWGVRMTGGGDQAG